MVFMSCNLVGGSSIPPPPPPIPLPPPLSPLPPFGPFVLPLMTSLLPGMFQRLEKMKKNAFASAILFGENNNSTISG